MKRPRLRTVLLVIIIAPILLLAAAAVFIKVRYPPEKIRALALDWAGRHLNRRIALGDARLGLSGLELKDLVVAEREGFPAGDFVSIQRLSVQPNLLMLLSRRLVVRSVFVESPSVVLRRRADGAMNIDDLSSGETPAAGGRTTPAVAPARAAFFVRKITLRRGRVRWADDVRGDDLAAENLTVDLTNFSLSTPFEAALSADVKGKTGGRPVGTRLALESRVDLPGQGLRVKKTEVALGGSKITLSGAVQQWSSPQLDLVLGLAPLRADDLAPFADLPAEARGAWARAELGLQGPLDRLKVSGPLTVAALGAELSATLDADVRPRAEPPAFDVKVRPRSLARNDPQGGPPLSGDLAGLLAARGTSEKIAFELDLDLTKAAIQHPAFLKPAGALLKIKADGAHGPSGSSLNALRLDTAAGALSGRGALRSAKRGSDVEAKVETPGLDLSVLGGWIPALRAYEPKGKLGLSVEASVNTAGGKPRARGSARLSDVGAAPAAGVALEALTGVVTFSDDEAAMKDLRGRLWGAPFALTLAAKDFQRPSVSYDLRLDRLDLARALAVVSSTAPETADAPSAAPAGPPPIARAEGSVKIGEATHPNYTGRDFLLRGTLTDLGPDLSRLNGHLTFTAADGKIHDLPLAAKINKLMKKDAADITYRSVGGRFAIERGVLSTDDFALDSGQTDLSAKGRVRLTDLDADLKATVRLAAGAVGGSLGDWTAGPDGRPTLTAKITGPLTDPKIAVDLSQAAKNAAKDLLQKGLEKLRKPEGDGGSNAVDKAVDQGLKSLEKLFKKR